MRRVSILVFEQCLASSITLPLEMLNAADSLARANNRRQPGLQIELLGLKTGPIKTAGGLTIHTDASYTTARDIDLLIIPALWRDPQKTLRNHRSILPWLSSLAEQGCLICAVGTSSCLLAEADLLDHKPATTHWFYCGEFAQRYPMVELKRQYLITQADNLFCAGSVNSVADLMVHLVDRFYGHRIARAVEGQFSPEIRRPFESHAYAENHSNIHHDELIIEAQEWLRKHCGEAVQLHDLAEKLQLSMRSFNRRFKQATGITASQYLLQQRINSSAELLRTSNLSIAEVAAQCGYQDSSHFCAKFKKEMQKSPLAYRKAVRGKLFTVS